MMSISSNIFKRFLKFRCTILCMGRNFTRLECVHSHDDPCEQVQLEYFLCGFLQHTKMMTKAFLCIHYLSRLESQYLESHAKHNKTPLFSYSSFSSFTSWLLTTASWWSCSVCLFLVQQFRYGKQGGSLQVN